MKRLFFIIFLLTSFLLWGLFLLIPSNHWLDDRLIKESGQYLTEEEKQDSIRGNYFQARAIDEHGAISDGSSRSITLTDAPITATCTPSVTSVNLGQPVTWTVNDLLGGTGVYSYSWSGTERLTGTTNPLSKSYTMAGTKNASVVITSGNQTKTVNCTVSVTSDQRVDLCPNFEGIQTTVPVGFTRDTAGNCLCTSAASYTLTVSKSGAGIGNVSSSPGGISCGADCVELYSADTVVSLTADSAVGSTFTGWSRDCITGGQVIMNTDKTCVATFVMNEPIKPNLTIKRGSTLPKTSTIIAGAPQIITTIVQNFDASTITGFKTLFQVARESSGAGATSLSVNLRGVLDADTEGSVESSPYAFTSAGTYYIRACADSDAGGVHTIDESNEDDNCGEWTSIIVLNPVVGTDGTCGGANGTSRSSPPTVELCGVTSTTPVVTTNPTTFTWTCTGKNGGKDANCSAKKTITTTPISGVCGVSHQGRPGLSPPTDNLCDVTGSIPIVTTNPNNYSWTCTGMNGGEDASCSSRRITRAVRTAGACGGAHGVYSATIPTANLCAIGEPSAVSGSGPWRWTCAGINGGLGADCSAEKITSTTSSPGVCGGAHLSKTLTAPTINLCDVTRSTPTVTTTGTNFTWTCTGINGGADTSCGATKITTVIPIPGVCGGAHGSSATTKPTTDLCNTGTPSAVSGFGPWTWQCGGMSGGDSVACTTSARAYNGCFAEGNMRKVPTLDTYADLLKARMGILQFGHSLSDSDRIVQNQNFWKQLSSNINRYITNNYTPTLLVGGWGENMIYLDNNNAAALVGSPTTIKNVHGYYYYKSFFGGRVTLDHTTANIIGQKVLLVEGADVQINDNITYNSSESSLVIIVRKGLSGGGNVYIHPSVTKINATLIADGALMNGVRGVAKNWIDNESSLQNNLIINGRLLTRNTRGGSLQENVGTLVQRTSSGKCGGNSSTPDCLDISTAAAQDLERFRLTTNTTGQCTLYVTGTHIKTVDILSRIEY